MDSGVAGVWVCHHAANVDTPGVRRDQGLKLIGIRPKRDAGNAKTVETPVLRELCQRHDFTWRHARADLCLERMSHSVCVPAYGEYSINCSSTCFPKRHRLPIYLTTERKTAHCSK